MDFVFWIILIAVIVGVVWWLLNRSGSTGTSGSAGKDGAGSSAGDGTIRADGALASGSAAASAEAAATTGIPGAAGFGRAAEPAPPTTADETRDVSGTEVGGTAHPAQPAAASAAGPSGAAPLSDSRSETGQSGSSVASGRETENGTSSPAPADEPAQESGRLQEDGGALEGTRAQEDAAEWETQWSEASGSTAAPGEDNRQAGASAGTNSGPTAAAEPVHHAEYTGPHSPTLPGAETAAGEGPAEWSAGGSADASAEERTDLPDDAAAAETLDRTQSSAAVETAASHTEEPVRDGAEYGTGTEPAGHLAVDQPYGEGSASPDSDGSGPADYTVKGDAASMVYYEEGHPDYEQTRAEVWFESAAHAEAAGFRAPRRNRL